MSICADIIMSPFRDRLKAAARYAGVEYGQTAIAESLGVSKQTVDQWMGNGRPSAELLYLIADKWKVSPRWLAIEQGDMIPSQDGRKNPLDSKTKPRVPEAEQLLALILTFLETDAEGRKELVKLARSVAEGYASAATSKNRGAKR